MYRILQRLCFGLVFFSSLCLVACNGNSNQENSSLAAIARDETAPTVVLGPNGGALDRAGLITVRFSESMNPSSLRLSGVLAAQATSAWSSTNNTNDTLTLTPTSGIWRGNDSATLSLDANDLAGNHLVTLRVSYFIPLVFNNYQAATTVIGQTDFSSNIANQGVLGANAVNASKLSITSASQVNSDGQLFVADLGNNRVLGFNTVPTINNPNADFVLGQPTLNDFVNNNARDGMDGPRQVAFIANKLIVADTMNHRLLIYNSIPNTTGALPDVVVGQSDFIQVVSQCSQSSFFDGPYGVAVAPQGKLIATDRNRVLIWNSIPDQNYQAADMVLGQADFTHCTENDNNQDGNADLPSAKVLNAEIGGVWTDGTRLVIGDRGNHRILIWNTFPTQNFQAADLVLGQADFTQNLPNAGLPNPSAATLNFPGVGISSNGTQLAVTDYDNHRVLIWNTFPTKNFQAADQVLGQAAFNTANKLATSSQTLNDPYGVFFYKDKLIVSDLFRVLIFQAQ